MDHVALDAADAAELIEILEYFTETLDRASKHDTIACLIDDLELYRVTDLQADLARLINELQRGQLTP